MTNQNTAGLSITPYLFGRSKPASRNPATACFVRPYNPAIDVKLPTDKSTGRAKTEMHFLEEGQIAALSAQLAEPYSILLLFMAYTGRRAGEVSGVDIADLDLLHRRVNVRRARRKDKGGWEEHLPKNGRTHEVPLPGWLADAT